MKTIKSALISLAISLLFLNTTVANNDFPVIKVVDKKLFLSLDNVSTETSVVILDGTGETLMEEKVAFSKQFESVFNFENFPLGSYTLIFKSNSRRIVKRMTITSKALIMEEEETAVPDSPATLLQKRGKLKISMMNPNNNLVRVFIIDLNGRMRYQNAFQGQEIIEQELNLKKLLPSGKYTIIVDAVDEVYSKTIKL